MDEKKKLYWWQDMSWCDIVERAKEVDIAILPLGSIEWHGPHLPTGHDTYQLFPMLEAIAERTGAMLLPCPWYGAHPFHHYGVPGSIPLKNDTMRALIKDVIHGASVAGYKKFFLFFGHGQSFVTNYVVHELGAEGFFVASVMFQNMAKDVHFEIMETPFWHACESETSIGLYTHPDLVNMKKATKGTASALVDSKFFTGVADTLSKPCRFDELTLVGPEIADVEAGHSGVYGDATLGTREKGEKYVKVIVDRMSDFVNHIKEKYPVGVMPFHVRK